MQFPICSCGSGSSNKQHSFLSLLIVEIDLEICHEDRRKKSAIFQKKSKTGGCGFNGWLWRSSQHTVSVSQLSNTCTAAWGPCLCVSQDLCVLNIISPKKDKQRCGPRGGRRVSLLSARKITAAFLERMSDGQRSRDVSFRDAPHRDT